ncbi:MAG: heme A synthase [Gemmatimonadetes bacterium]|nr:heme A synthase [Gemmatimonadota bacterium]
MPLRRLAQLTIVVTLLVILWGALVRATGSGAGCGRHWPLCNGEVVPQAPAAATAIEFTHRVTSGLALIMVVWLWAAARRRSPPGHRVRRAAAWSLLFIAIEAAIGAGLVLLELVGDDRSALRAWYLAFHLANTFALLAALVATAHWADRPDPGARPPVPKALVALLALLLTVGATGAVTALGDTLFPAGSLAEGLGQHRDPAAHWLVRLRIIHPALAVVAAVVAAVIGIRLLIASPGPAVALAARLMVVGIFAQLLVGVVNLVLLVPIATQLTHLLVADLVWMAAILLALEVRDVA